MSTLPTDDMLIGADATAVAHADASPRASACRRRHRGRGPRHGPAIAYIADIDVDGALEAVATATRRADPGHARPATAR